jgi:hypothetical protein
LNLAKIGMDSSPKIRHLPFKIISLGGVGDRPFHQTEFV